MKKYIALALLAVMLFSALSGCSQKQDDGKLSIVCTLFPQYDWLRNIVGDSADVTLTLLIQNGTDPHSYQPTAADVMTVSSCDMIVYLDGTSDAWVKEALERSKNKDVIRIALTEAEGMTLHEISSHSHEHSEHEHEHEHDHAHGTLDEHIWLSLKNAVTATRLLCDTVCELDPKNAELYRQNAANYIEKLSALDEKYTRAVSSVAEENRFLLFADRFPFVYLLSDYGIEYAAAFEGCTTDVDASFDTVLRLIKEATAHSVRYIAITESSDGALARTVAGSAEGDIEITVMNSLQSVTRAELTGGISYLKVMESNLLALGQALGVTGE